MISKSQALCSVFWWLPSNHYKKPFKSLQTLDRTYHICRFHLSKGWSRPSTLLGENCIYDMQLILTSLKPNVCQIYCIPCRVSSKVTKGGHHHSSTQFVKDCTFHASLSKRLVKTIKLLCYVETAFMVGSVTPPELEWGDVKNLEDSGVAPTRGE